MYAHVIRSLMFGVSCRVYSLVWLTGLAHYAPCNYTVLRYMHKQTYEACSSCCKLLVAQALPAAMNRWHCRATVHCSTTVQGEAARGNINNKLMNVIVEWLTAVECL